MRAAILEGGRTPILATSGSSVDGERDYSAEVDARPRRHQDRCPAAFENRCAHRGALIALAMRSLLELTPTRSRRSSTRTNTQAPPAASASSSISGGRVRRDARSDSRKARDLPDPPRAPRSAASHRRRSSGSRRRDVRFEGTRSSTSAPRTRGAAGRGSCPVLVEPGHGPRRDACAVLALPGRGQLPRRAAPRVRGPDVELRVPDRTSPAPATTGRPSPVRCRLSWCGGRMGRSAPSRIAARIAAHSSPSTTRDRRASAFSALPRGATTSRASSSASPSRRDRMARAMSAPRCAQRFSKGAGHHLG